MTLLGFSITRESDRHPTDESTADFASMVRSAGPLLITISAVAAMSWSGLFGFGTDEMRWSPSHSLLLPLALDMAAIATAEYAFRRIGKGESGLQFRLIAASLVATSAFINWRGALRSGNVGEEWVFPFMSVAVFWLVNAVMAARRRDVRREQHGQREKRRVAPLPRFGVLEWVLFAPTAFRAFRDAVGARQLLKPASRSTSHLPPRERTESSHPTGEAGAERIIAKSQSEAIRIAVKVVGTDAGRVVEHLASHGWPGVAKQRVWTVIDRDKRLRIVGTEATG